jgi:hypothetical protein
MTTPSRIFSRILISLGSLFATLPAWADEVADQHPPVESLPQIMPAQAGGNCDSSNGGCKQMSDMRSMMSSMMHSAAGAAAVGGPGCKTAAQQGATSADSRMQAMQMMMGGMMNGMSR